jgi:uncharacterized repeat protein (TIGR03803 family)
MFKLSLWKALVVLSIFCFATAVAARAQTLTTLADFDGTNGDMPSIMTLIQATDGNFYGVTSAGGAYGMGTVFKVTAEGQLTTLHSFCAQTGCPDGRQPIASLVQGTDGNLYGTTSFGGANNDGTIFKITPEGQLTTLHVFNGTDGSAPSALIQASNGNFYGGTFGGGNMAACSNPGCGTIFELSAAGQFSTLHVFNGADGSAVNPLIQASDGNFYGTTYYGGLNECAGYPGCGTVFKMNPGGSLTTLYTFHGADGWLPAGTLVQATNQNFYGTTDWGGTSNLGTVFEITPAGELKTLHSFDLTDGSMPGMGMVQATDGNLYGTTVGGGPNAVFMFGGGYGTIFEITSEGEFINVQNFDLTDGSFPWGGLVQATDGNFYGTTQNGGTFANCSIPAGCGTIFSFSTGLAPFVKLDPGSGDPGVAVTIRGTDVTGATKVTFNGKAAAFKVVSSTEMQATVPAEATTGNVEITTPQHKLSSNVPFQVKRRVCCEHTVLR